MTGKKIGWYSFIENRPSFVGNEKQCSKMRSTIEISTRILLLCTCIFYESCQAKRSTTLACTLRRLSNNVLQNLKWTRFIAELLHCQTLIQLHAFLEILKQEIDTGNTIENAFFFEFRSEPVLCVSVYIWSLIWCIERHLMNKVPNWTRKGEKLCPIECKKRSSTKKASNWKERTSFRRNIIANSWLDICIICIFVCSSVWASSEILFFHITFRFFFTLCQMFFI